MNATEVLNTFLNIPALNHCPKNEKHKLVVKTIWKIFYTENFQASNIYSHRKGSELLWIYSKSNIIFLKQYLNIYIWKVILPWN